MNVPAPLPPVASTQARRLVPSELWRMFRERWLIGLLAGTAAAALVVYLEPGGPPEYRSEVYLVCSPRRGDPAQNANAFYDSRSQSSTVVSTHIEQLRSKAFFEYLLTSFSPEEIKRIQAPYIDRMHPDEAPPSLATILWPSVSFFSRKNTPILGIAVVSTDPENAVLIANRYARRYVEYNLDRSVTGTNSALVFLRKQTDDLRRQVVVAEEALQGYRATNNLATLGETQGVVVQKLASLGATLVRAQMEQVELQAVINDLDLFERTNRPLTDLPAVLNHGQVSAAKGGLENLRGERALLADRYLAKHPRMVQNALATTELRRQLDDAVARAVSDFRTRHEIATRYEKQLREELQATEQRARDLDKISIDYRLLEQDAVAKRAAYARLNERLNDLAISAQLENASIQIFDEAKVGTSPDAPPISPTALLASSAGLFGLIFVPLGLGLLDSRVKTSGHVETLLGQKLLGVLRHSRKTSSAENAQAFLRDKAGPITEAYRGLYSEIEIASTLAYPKSLLITSSTPGEGKSMIASNLAAVFSSHGRRTLLVDCDMRRPSLHHYFQVNGQNGWAQWLQQPAQERTPLSTVVVSLAPRLDLLPCGRPPANCTQVLEQLAHAGMQKQLLAEYDLVIFDTPPATVFPDALLLARSCHELIFICQFGGVDLGTAQRVLNRLTATGVRLLGIILNQAPGNWAGDGFYGYGGKTARYYRNYGERPTA